MGTRPVPTFSHYEVIAKLGEGGMGDRSDLHDQFRATLITRVVLIGRAILFLLLPHNVHAIHLPPGGIRSFDDCGHRLAIG